MIFSLSKHAELPKTSGLPSRSAVIRPASSHLNTNPQPIAQLLLGYHLGYVSQKNNWTLGEAIFIHTWWDVIAFSTIYHYKQAEPENEAVQRLKPVLWLPPLQFAF